jgi:hypothetical protein
VTALDRFQAVAIVAPRDKKKGRAKSAAFLV